MTTVSKIRNEIRFTREDGKYWAIDVNNRNIIGYKGAPIQRLPKNGSREIDNVIYGRCDATPVVRALVSCYEARTSASYMGFIERLAALNLANLNLQDCATYSCELEGLVVNLSERTVFGYARTLNDENDTFRCRDIVRYARKREFQDRFSKSLTRFGAESVEYAHSFAPHDFTDNDLYMVCYYAFDSHIEDLIANDWLSRRQVARRAVDVVTWCKALEIKPQKTCIIGYYEAIKADYEAKKDEIKSRVFAASQNSEWAFENDEFVAIVPKLISDLVKEGAALNNCLGGYWLRGYGNSEKHFARGVVFVRRKSSPNKSFVACDFRKDTMEIDQYYTTNNRSVEYDAAAMRFKRELQKHLRKFAQ